MKIEKKMIKLKEKKKWSSPKHVSYFSRERLSVVATRLISYNQHLQKNVLAKVNLNHEDQQEEWYKLVEATHLVVLHHLTWHYLPYLTKFIHVNCKSTFNNCPSFVCSASRLACERHLSPLLCVLDFNPHLIVLYISISLLLFFFFMNIRMILHVF